MTRWCGGAFEVVNDLHFCTNLLLSLPVKELSKSVYVWQNHKVINIFIFCIESTKGWGVSSRYVAGADVWQQWTNSLPVTVTYKNLKLHICDWSAVVWMTSRYRKYLFKIIPGEIHNLSSFFSFNMKHIMHSKHPCNVFWPILGKWDKFDLCIHRRRIFLVQTATRRYTDQWSAVCTFQRRHLLL